MVVCDAGVSGRVVWSAVWYGVLVCYRVLLSRVVWSAAPAPLLSLRTLCVSVCVSVCLCECVVVVRVWGRFSSLVFVYPFSFV